MSVEASPLARAYAVIQELNRSLTSRYVEIIRIMNSMINTVVNIGRQLAWFSLMRFYDKLWPTIPVGSMVVEKLPEFCIESLRVLFSPRNVLLNEMLLNSIGRFRREASKSTVGLAEVGKTPYVLSMLYPLYFPGVGEFAGILKFMSEVVVEPYVRIYIGRPLTSVSPLIKTLDKFIENLSKVFMPTIMEGYERLVSRRVVGEYLTRMKEVIPPVPRMSRIEIEAFSVPVLSSIQAFSSLIRTPYIRFGERYAVPLKLMGRRIHEVRALSPKSMEVLARISIETASLIRRFASSYKPYFKASLLLPMSYPAKLPIYTGILAPKISEPSLILLKSSIPYRFVFYPEFLRMGRVIDTNLAGILGLSRTIPLRMMRLSEIERAIIIPRIESLKVLSEAYKLSREKLMRDLAVIFEKPIKTYPEVKPVYEAVAITRRGLGPLVSLPISLVSIPIPPLISKIAIPSVPMREYVAKQRPRLIYGITESIRRKWGIIPQVVEISMEKVSAVEEVSRSISKGVEKVPSMKVTTPSIIPESYRALGEMLVRGVEEIAFKVVKAYPKMAEISALSEVWRSIKPTAPLYRELMSITAVPKLPQIIEAVKVAKPIRKYAVESGLSLIYAVSESIQRGIISYFVRNILVEGVSDLSMATSLQAIREHIAKMARRLVEGYVVGKPSIKLPITPITALSPVRILEIVSMKSFMRVPTPRPRILQPLNITIKVESLRDERDLRELERKIAKILREAARRYGVRL